MKIPSEIKVSGHIFKVCQVEYSEVGASGNVNMATQTITIRNGDIPEDKAAETLLHEIIEIITTYFDIDLSHQSLTTISEIIFQTIRDNDLDFRNV